MIWNANILMNLYDSYEAPQIFNSENIYRQNPGIHEKRKFD